MCLLLQVEQNVFLKLFAADENHLFKARLLEPLQPNNYARIVHRNENKQQFSVNLLIPYWHRWLKSQLFFIYNKFSHKQTHLTEVKFQTTHKPLYSLHLLQ